MSEVDEPRRRGVGGVVDARPRRRPSSPATWRPPGIERLLPADADDDRPPARRVRPGEGALRAALRARQPSGVGVAAAAACSPSRWRPVTIEPPSPAASSARPARRRRPAPLQRGHPPPPVGTSAPTRSDGGDRGSRVWAPAARAGRRHRRRRRLGRRAPARAAAARRASGRASSTGFGVGHRYKFRIHTADGYGARQGRSVRRPERAAARRPRR